MIPRRSLILATATAAALPTARFARAAPPAAPSLEFLAEFRVRIGERQPLGRDGDITESLVPIVGGDFEGPRLRGVIMTGESRHADRPGGRFTADVRYRLRTDDGVEITVKEHAVIDVSADQPPHGLSSLEFNAPDGPYGWLNRRVVVGALSVAAGEPLVRLRLFALR